MQLTDQGLAEVSCSAAADVLRQSHTRLQCMTTNSVKPGLPRLPNLPPMTAETVTAAELGSAGCCVRRQVPGHQGRPCCSAPARCPNSLMSTSSDIRVSGGLAHPCLKPGQLRAPPRQVQIVANPLRAHQGNRAGHAVLLGLCQMSHRSDERQQPHQGLSHCTCLP